MRIVSRAPANRLVWGSEFEANAIFCAIEGPSPLTFLNYPQSTRWTVYRASVEPPVVPRRQRQRPSDSTSSTASDICDYGTFDVDSLRNAVSASRIQPGTSQETALGYNTSKVFGAVFTVYSG